MIAYIQAFILDPNTTENEVKQLLIWVTGSSTLSNLTQINIALENVDEFQVNTCGFTLTVPFIYSQPEFIGQLPFALKILISEQITTFNTR